MFRRLAAVFIWLGLGAFATAAQTVPAGTAIRDDLLIALKTEAPNGPTEEIKITADGDWTRQFTGGLPVVLDGIDVEPPPLDPKLSRETLRALLAEFERIEFRRFGVDFPLDDGPQPFLTCRGKETITLRLGGETKEVGGDRGDLSRRGHLLHELGEKIRRAVGVAAEETGIANR